LFAGHPQRRIESLVHFVICETQGIAGIFGFLCAHRQWSQRLGSLPRALVDERFLISNKPLPLTLQKGKMRHSVTRCPGEDQAKQEQD
jgi:hypothetical protein